MEEESKPKPIVGSIPAEPPPNITEFPKWLGYHLAKDWRLILKAPIAFLAVVLFAVSISWLFIWHVVVPEKNEQLSTKQGVIDGKQSQLDYVTKKLEEAEKENDKLRSEPERHKLLDNLQVLQSANAALLKENSSLKSENAIDMTVYITITNSRNQSIQINPIGAMEISESFGGGGTFYNDEPFRITPRDSETVTSPIVMAAHESREFKFRMGKDKRLLFERGAAVLNCTVYDYGGSQQVKQNIPFNQDDLRKTNFPFKF
jgi:hypothetical protein